jgi:hypothetical protein
LAGLDSREDDGLAEIELTYSILDDINQARPAFGRPAVCIIQVSIQLETMTTLLVSPFDFCKLIILVLLC